MSDRRDRTLQLTLRLMPRDHCSVCPVCNVCNVGALWPSGWMNQDATWYGGRHRPGRHCVIWESSFPHGKGHSSPHTFRVMSIVAKRSPTSTTAEHRSNSRGTSPNGLKTRALYKSGICDTKPAISLKQNGLEPKLLQSVYRNVCTAYRLVTKSGDLMRPLTYVVNVMFSVLCYNS